MRKSEDTKQPRCEKVVIILFLFDQEELNASLSLIQSKDAEIMDLYEYSYRITLII